MNTKLTRLQRDALKEVASLGAGSASNSLSKMTDKTILVDFINVDFISLLGVPKLFPNSKEEIVSVSLGVEGDLTGLMLFLSTESTAAELTKLVTDRNGSSIEAEQEDVLKEINNILTGSYLAALSDMTKLHLLESVPSYLIGPIKNVIKESEKKMNKDISTAILLETLLLVGEEMKKYKVEIVFMLTPKELDKLFDRMFKDL